MGHRDGRRSTTIEYKAFWFKHHTQASQAALRVKTALSMFDYEADYGMAVAKDSQAILILVAREENVMRIMTIQCDRARPYPVNGHVKDWLRARGYRV